MPCDTIRTVGVKLEASNPTHMFNALQALGLGPVQYGDVVQFGNGETLNTKTGQARLAPFRNVNEIRRAYSAQIIQAVNKAKGWTVKEQPSTQPGQQVFVGMKRTFGI